MHHITLPNGVAKTTHANRLAPALSAVLSAVRLPHSEVRVLDLPSSTGITSLDTFALLQERYRVTSYVLGDFNHSILYDPARRCIFDEQGNLLQIACGRVFFKLYRGGVFGSQYTFKMKCLALPHRITAWCLRRRYRFERSSTYRRLLLINPEIERFLGEGVFHLEEMDIFQPIPGCYDLILSFHLLQPLYFPADAIEAGVKNLAASLCEGGLLIIGITGSEESYIALQKQDGSLISRLQEGKLFAEIAAASLESATLTLEQKPGEA